MVGGPMKLAVNEFIVSNPVLALEITAGLVGAGVASLKLRDIMKIVGLKESDLPKDGMAEVELLDDQAPEGFFGQPVTDVHADLVEWRMRGDIALPQVGWKHGLWSVTRRIGGFSRLPFVTTARSVEIQGYNLTEIATPAMNESKELV